MKTLQTVLPQALQHGAERTERIRGYIEGSMPANTKRAYQKAWRAFEMFCSEHTYQALPADVDGLVDYITLMASAGRKVATIEQAVAAITWVHRSANHPNPRDNAKVRQALKGIRAKVGTAPRRKEPVLRKQLKSVLDAQGSDLRGIRNRAILLCGWMGAFPPLRAGRARCRRHPLHRRWRNHHRAAQQDRPRRRWLAEAPAQAERPNLLRGHRAALLAERQPDRKRPLFRAITKYGMFGAGYMNGKEIARIIKSACTLAGLDAKQFSGHSLLWASSPKPPSMALPHGRSQSRPATSPTALCSTPTSAALAVVPEARQCCATGATVMKVIGETRIGSILIELSPHEFFAQKSIEIPLDVTLNAWLYHNDMTTLNAEMLVGVSASLLDKVKQSRDYSENTEQRLRTAMQEYPTGAKEIWGRMHDAKYGHLYNREASNETSTPS